MGKCSNGGGGSNIAGLKVELKYAQMKYSEYARKSSLTNAARGLMEQWGAEVKRLSEQVSALEEKKKKKKGFPLF